MENYIEKNEFGELLFVFREGKGYSQEEVCDGICSIATYSRIESGERTVDFLMLRLLMNRMKMRPEEYEILIDKKEYDEYEERNKINLLIEMRNVPEAEKRLQRYEKEKGKDRLHRQYILQKRADLEKLKKNKTAEELFHLYEEALVITVPEYQKKLNRMELITDNELHCITELAYHQKKEEKKEELLKQLYKYSMYQQKKATAPLISYCLIMQYYAELLFEKEDYEECINLCNNALELLYGGGNVHNRGELFFLRGMSEQKLKLEEQAQRDFMTAYYVFLTFDAEPSRAERVKQQIKGEDYGSI